MKVAIVQKAPVHFDLDGTLEKAIDAIEEASGQGAQLVVFGETWFCGYPAWLDYAPEVAFWDHKPVKKLFAKMLDNSLDLESKALKKLRDVAKEKTVGLVVGANEVGKLAKGSIFNTIFVIDEKGQLVNHHRKLVPTYTEKMLYAHGDGQGLKSSTIFGTKVSASVCWEHWMPLTRQALHDSGEEIHVALWPKVHEMHQIASRQYAFEGRCFVLAAGQMLKASDLPEELKFGERISSEEWILNGGSCVIRPSGKYLVPPQFDEEKLIYAEIDLNEVKEESMTLDVSGHYQRHDIFGLEINRSRKK